MMGSWSSVILMGLLAQDSDESTDYFGSKPKASEPSGGGSGSLFALDRGRDSLTSATREQDRVGMTRQPSGALPLRGTTLPRDERSGRSNRDEDEYDDVVNDRVREELGGWGVSSGNNRFAGVGASRSNPDYEELSVGGNDSDEEDPAEDRGGEYGKSESFELSTSEQEVSGSAALEGFDYTTHAMPPSSMRRNYGF